jgi:hypothetical protein
MGVTAGLIGPAISGAGALFGLAKGAPASNVAMPSYQSMQLPNVSDAAGAFFQGTGGLQSAFNPLYQNIAGLGGTTLNNLYSDPNAAAYLAAAGPAGNMGMNAAIAQYGLGTNLAGAGTAALATGMDPQNMLYARTLQQLQDQMNVQNANAGVASTPYGAGLVNQGMSNFNIDWQNAQLQRQLAALQGAGGAFGQGAGLMAGAPGQYLQSAGLPYMTSQGIGGAQFGALGQYGGLLGTAQAGENLPLQNYLQYIGAGTAANANANQAAYNQLQQANMGFNQNQMLGRQLGSAISGAGTGWARAGLPSAWGSPGAAWGGYNTTGL